MQYGRDIDQNVKTALSSLFVSRTVHVYIHVHVYVRDRFKTGSPF